MKIIFLIKIILYCKEYYALIKDRERVKYWKQLLEKGKSITIYDFDGPRNEDKSVACLELSEDLLREKINDVSMSFGHGYVVAMILNDMDLSILN